MTLLVLASLAAGVLVGATALPPAAAPYLDDASTAALGLLLFAIGIEVGSDRAVWARLRSLGFRALAVPALVATGSIAGGWAASFAAGLTPREGAAVGAGFGWYTLSGVLLTRLEGPELGTLAFLANVSREVLAFLVIPWLARVGGPLVALAPGGATTMDTTLPLIVRVTDAETAVLAVVNGTVLSALVPFAIGAIAG